MSSIERDMYYFDGGIPVFFYSGNIHEENPVTGFSDDASPLVVNSAGYVRFDTRGFATQRTRSDYYLIYLLRGTCHFRLDDELFRLRPGSLLLCHPMQMQDYQYFQNDLAEFYWVHFTGNDVEALLRGVDLLDGHHYHAGLHMPVSELFEHLIRECQLRKYFFETITAALLIQLLGLMGRAVHPESRRLAVTRHELDTAIACMHREYPVSHPISHYARMASLSLGQFIRRFKSTMHVPPSQYIEKLRIDKARELLSSSDLPVGEIAAVVGIPDPFYFSKVFKRATGQTPTAFRSLSRSIAVSGPFTASD